MAHGPALLGSDGYIAAGLRCAFAYPRGLELVVVLAAVDEHADAASPHAFPRPEAIGGEPWSALQLTVTADGRTAGIEPFASDATGDGARMCQECRYFVEPLPADPHLTIAVAWPQIGLTEHRTQLRLDLERIDERALWLLPGR